MITSTGNDRVRRVAALTKKARERAKEGAFVVEGIKMFREAPADSVRGAYASESFIRNHADQLDEETRRRFDRGGDYEIVSDKVFAAMSDTKSPQGILCVVETSCYALEDLLGRADGQQPLVMVLEDLQDPGNLGTIVRTAEGAGVTGILMSRGTADLYNPKVTRSTMGSIYRMPFVYTDDLHADIRWLKDRGLKLWAAHLKGRHSYEGECYEGPSGFLIGNESRGLTKETADLADGYIRIPMAGQVESLNAAIASGILMYEAARQRRKGADA